MLMKESANFVDYKEIMFNSILVSPCPPAVQIDQKIINVINVLAATGISLRISVIVPPAENILHRSFPQLRYIASSNSLNLGGAFLPSAYYGALI